MSLLIPDTGRLPPQAAIDRARLPVVYEEAKTALATCERVDECKSWSDKASAIASYARQADDKTLLNHALRIQARAQRRVGELLDDYKLPPQEKRLGGVAPTKSQRLIAAQHGLSKDQEVAAKRAAAIPHEEFEAAVESDDPPTREQLSEMGRRRRLEDDIPPRIEGEAEATFVRGDLGRLLERCKDKDPVRIANGVRDWQLYQTIQQSEAVITWLQQFCQHLRGRSR